MPLVNPESIATECDAIKALLIEKNQKYNNSAESPLRVFSSADNLEQIKVRIDDKLSRIANRVVNDDEDTVKDLIGYLILYRIIRRNNGNNER